VNRIRKNAIKNEKQRYCDEKEMVTNGHAVIIVLGGILICRKMLRVNIL